MVRNIKQEPKLYQALGKKSYENKNKSIRLHMALRPMGPWALGPWAQGPMGRGPRPTNQVFPWVTQAWEVKMDTDIMVPAPGLINRW